MHLVPVYRQLADRLRSSARAEWLAEEMASLIQSASYATDPLRAFRRLKSRSGNDRMLAAT